MLLFFRKSNVNAYVKNDGTFVNAYTTFKQGAPKPTPQAWHPSPNDKGKLVGLYAPHAPSDPATWGDHGQQATFVPGGSRPDALNGVPFTPWDDAPETTKGWNAVTGQDHTLKEPPLPQVAADMHIAAGVVVEEPDGRVWTVSPTNRFGNYDNTFPKGTIDPGLHPQAAAIKEAFEESGLRVAITGYLGDFKRTTSVTRYYRARRVGGDPTEMGWESQAVHLVPKSDLHHHAYHQSDAPLVAAIQKG